MSGVMMPSLQLSACATCRPITITGLGTLTSLRILLGLDATNSKKSTSAMSAEIVQAAIVVHIGYPQKTLVLAYCKETMHPKPNITQQLLQNFSTTNAPKTVEMGDTGCFLHTLGDKGAFAVCLTKGKKNMKATFGFLNSLLEDFYKGHPGDQGQFSNVSRSSGASSNGGMKSMMSKWNGPNIMKTQQLKAELNNTIDLIGNTINQLTIRGDALVELMDQAEDLAKKAEEVRAAGEAVYWKMWRRWAKWIAFIVFMIFLLILFIVVGICATGGCSS